MNGETSVFEDIKGLMCGGCKKKSKKTVVYQEGMRPLPAHRTPLSETIENIPAEHVSSGNVIHEVLVQPAPHNIIHQNEVLVQNANYHGHLEEEFKDESRAIRETYDGGKHLQAHNILASAPVLEDDANCMYCKRRIQNPEEYMDHQHGYRESQFKPKNNLEFIKDGDEQQHKASSVNFDQGDSHKNIVM